MSQQTSMMRCIFNYERFCETCKKATTQRFRQRVPRRMGILNGHFPYCPCRHSLKNQNQFSLNRFQNIPGRKSISGSSLQHRNPSSFHKITFTLHDVASNLVLVHHSASNFCRFRHECTLRYSYLQTRIVMYIYLAPSHA